MKENHKASQTFNTILRYTLGTYIKVKFKMEPHDDEIKNLKGPYIILANHTNNWDPFMLSVYVKEPVHFVAGEGNFKNPLLRWALIKLVGAISKTKFMPDSATIKQILKVKNSNGVIGIFPEGQRNWDGVTGDLLYSTAKLIKSLKLPVATVVLKGAYLSHPRWAKSSRRGKVELHYSLALTPDKIKQMSVDEIFNDMSKKLYHDEMLWQKQNNIFFQGADAERLELFLFACPHCGVVETLVSKGKEFMCTSCGYSVNYDGYGALASKSEVTYFDNLHQWDNWQLKLLYDKVDNLSHDEVLAHFDDVTIHEGKKMRNFSNKFSGSLYLYKNKLLFKYKDGREADFYISAMDGVNVNQNRRVEFFYNKTMYRITFNKKFESAYMWVSAINYIKEKQV